MLMVNELCHRLASIIKLACEDTVVLWAGMGGTVVSTPSKWRQLNYIIHRLAISSNINSSPSWKKIMMYAGRQYALLVVVLVTGDVHAGRQYILLVTTGLQQVGCQDILLAVHPADEVLCCSLAR